MVAVRTDTTTEAGTFLRSLFAHVDPTYQIEIRSITGGDVQRTRRQYVNVAAPDPVDLAEGVNHFFSVAAKPSGPGKPQLGGFVWADLDTVSPTFDPATIRPQVTEAIASGHGYHLYWRFENQIVIDDAVRLSTIAAMAFDGDKHVNESQRLLRLPGTTNAKTGKVPSECKTAFRSPIEYDPNELEEWLIAAVIARTWIGSRHYMALGAAATLYRAEWPIESAERIIENVCTITGDEERADRVRSVQDTYKRAAAGESVSAQEFRDALVDSIPHGAKDSPFGEFLVALGVQGKDADITLDGVPIGTKYTIEQDILRYLLESGEWAMAGGFPMLWNGQYWERKQKEQLVTSVFQFLEKLEIVIGDLSVPMPAHHKLADIIATLLVGGLAELPPPDSRWLPVQNGVLDLDSGELLAHDKKYRSRWVIPLEYDSEAESPTWLRFISEAAPATVGYLQEWFGYCLVADNPSQLMAWLHGPSGTGKSTFIHGLQSVLGAATVAIDSGSLNDYNVAALADSRVAICTEVGNRTLKTAKLKSLVAGDSIGARNPYGRPFTFAYTGKLIWASNSTPPVDESEGMFRRIAMIPFSVKPKVADQSLWTKITAERQGILNWALVGLARVQRYIANNNWPVPSVVSELTEEYRKDSETFVAFVSGELRPAKDEVISQSLVYARYRFWSNENGHLPVPNGPIFRKALRMIGLEDGPDIIFHDKMNGSTLPGWKGYEMVERNIF